MFISFGKKKQFNLILNTKKRFHSVFKSGSHSFKCSYWILTMHADAEEKSYPKMGMF